MFIYSGERRMCQVGFPTKLIDDCGKQLRTGDVVISYTIAKNMGVCSIAGLTAIVANHYDNVQGKSPIEKSDKGEPFVMGIKSCDIKEPAEDYPETVWRVHRVKRYEDVLIGEHWREFGFSYR